MRVHSTVLLASTACFLAVSAAFGVDRKPVDSNRPLFRIFEAIPMKEKDSHHRFRFDDKRPLLVVSTVDDVLLDRDGKGVLLTLNASDTKKFAVLTRQFDQRLLLLEAGGRIFEVLRISAPVEDGKMTFKHPDDGEVAEYIRKRFRIGEFR